MVVDCDINKLYEVGLSPTAFCYLYYIYKELDYPFQKSIPVNIIMGLQQQGWIRLTTEGVLLLPKFYEFIQVKEDTKKVESWIKEYCDLWPTGITNGGNPVKSAKANCLKKMKTFLNEHKKITKADIIEATNIYLERKKRDNYKFTTSSQNFIYKDGISLLLTIIEDGKAREEYRENLKTKDEGEGSAFHKQV